MVVANEAKRLVAVALSAKNLVAVALFAKRSVVDALLNVDVPAMSVEKSP